MSEKKKGGSFFNIETIIIGAFFLFFIMWAAQKCNNAPKNKQLELDKARQAYLKDSINKFNAKAIATPPAPVTVTTPAPTTVQATTTPQVAQPTQVTPPPAQQSTTTTTPKKVEGQKLYVVIDGLNVRAEPKLKAKSFGKLKLFDEVTFLGKVTEETQKLSLGTDEAEEPWVKIRTKRGTEGWVFGAGVSYYKKKRKGVL